MSTDTHGVEDIVLPAAGAAGSDDERPVVEPADAPALAAATGAGLAGRLQAGVKRLQADRTHRFDVPGWDGDLVVRAKKLDEPTIDRADTALKTIALATDTVLLREDPDAPFQELTWRQIGDMMGAPAETTVTTIIAGVFDRNGAAIRVFCGELLAWMAGRQAAIDQLLGE